MKIFVRLVFAMALAGALPAGAQAPIGFVKTVSGEASVADAGKAAQAQVGTPVRLGSVLKTGPTGAMGVTFKDNTVVSIGPDTELTVDEYFYGPGKDNLRFGASMTRGTLDFISGVIARLRPEAVVVKTPTGTIGVRGTHFAVKVEP
jgi:hypothetical protein